MNPAAAGRTHADKAPPKRRAGLVALALGCALLGIVPFVAANAPTEPPRIDFAAQDLEVFRLPAAPQDPWWPTAELEARREADDGPRSAIGIHGRIVDPAGQPVGGAAIRWVAFDGGGDALRLKKVARSGGDGTFAIAGSTPAHRQFVLVALHGAHAPTFASRTLPGQDERIDLGDLPLSTGGSAAGQVVDANGAPIADATVHLRPTTGRFLDCIRAWSDLLPTARTDERGRFRVDHLPAGPYRVEAWATGRQRTSRPAALPIENGITADAGALVLQPGHRLAGIVLGPDGAPQADAEVRIRNAPSAGAGVLVRAFARTAADGSFGLDHLPDRALRVEVAARGCLLWAREPIDPAVDQPLRVELEPGLSLAGRVVDAETREPVTHFTFVVQATNPDLEDDNPMPAAPAGLPAPTAHAGGRFVEHGLDAGHYRVGIQAPGRAWSQSAPIRLQPGDSPELVVELVRGLSLAGVVVGADRSPLAGARVELRRAGADPKPPTVGLPGPADASSEPLVRATNTDAQGRFRFDDLAPATFALHARHAGHVPHRSAPFALDGPRDPIEVALSPAATLAGTVQAGPGPTGIQVLAYGGAERVHVVRATADGQFRIEGLAPGAYLVRACLGDLRDLLRSRIQPLTAPDGSPTAADVVLAPGEVRNLSLRLEAPAVGTLVGRVVATEAGASHRLTLLPAEPLAAGAVRFDSRHLSTDAAGDGSFRFDSVPAGDYALHCARRGAQDGAAIRPLRVTVVADQERRLDVPAGPTPPAPTSPPGPQPTGGGLPTKHP